MCERRTFCLVCPRVTAAAQTQASVNYTLGPDHLLWSTLSWNSGPETHQEPSPQLNQHPVLEFLTWV